jgi:hypothetical protein
MNPMDGWYLASSQSPQGEVQTWLLSRPRASVQISMPFVESKSAVVVSAVVVGLVAGWRYHVCPPG